MIEEILKIISTHPKSTASAFAAVNFLWPIFLYYNKKRHETEIVKLRADLDHKNTLDIEKRRKLFEIKAIQFEKYFKMVDDFEKKHSVDMPRRMQPIVNEYFEKSLKAQDENNEESSRMALIDFSNGIQTLMAEGYEDYMAIKKENHSLKLIATDQLAELFSKLENQYKKSFEVTQEFMGNFDQMLVNNDTDGINQFQEQAKKEGAILEEIL